MQNKTVSIILPVYNAERFLSPCIESVLQQTYTAWELIAVDDGSSDSSLEILQSYAEKNQRINVLSKKNEGVSIARNIALEQTKGEYVYFADADDVLMPDALSVLVEAMERYQATFVKADFLPIDENEKQVFVNKKQVIRKRFDGTVMNADKFFKKVLMKEYFLWTCLFRRDLIEKYQIRFIPHCRLMEDSAFIVDYLLHSDRNVYRDACVYGYRKYEGTVSAVKKDYSQDLVMILAHIEKSNVVGFQLELKAQIERVLSEAKSSEMKKKLVKVLQFLDRIKNSGMYVYYKLKS